MICSLQNSHISIRYANDLTIIYGKILITKRVSRSHLFSSSVYSLQQQVSILSLLLQLHLHRRQTVLLTDESTLFIRTTVHCKSQQFKKHLMMVKRRHVSIGAAPPRVWLVWFCRLNGLWSRSRPLVQKPSAPGPSLSAALHLCLSDTVADPPAHEPAETHKHSHIVVWEHFYIQTDGWEQA